MKNLFDLLCYRIFMAIGEFLWLKFPRAAMWILSFAGRHANTRDEI